MRQSLRFAHLARPVGTAAEPVGQRPPGLTDLVVAAGLPQPQERLDPFAVGQHLRQNAALLKLPPTLSVSHGIVLRDDPRLGGTSSSGSSRYRRSNASALALTSAAARKS